MSCTHTNNGLQLSIKPDPRTKCIKPLDHLCMDFRVSPVSLLHSSAPPGGCSNVRRALFSLRKLSIPKRDSKHTLIVVLAYYNQKKKSFYMFGVLTTSKSYNGDTISVE